MTRLWDLDCLLCSNIQGIFFFFTAKTDWWTSGFRTVPGSSFHTHTKNHWVTAPTQYFVNVTSLFTPLSDHVLNVTAGLKNQ